MTSTKDITAKFAVAIVAVAMVFAAFAPSAKAQTTEDLQQMINDLLAQVAALQSQLGQDEAAPAAGVCPYTWTRDLSAGSEGMDVMKLQQFLNSDPDTRVAVEGAGSPGMETEYYGPATAAAVSKMQVKYRSEVLSPANLVNPTGYFGPSSRAKANSVCVAAPEMEEEEEEEATEEEEEEDAEDMELSGEASLNDAELDDASDNEVEEGAEDTEVAEFTVEFEDGDAEISRIDVKFTTGDATDNWDVLESVSLWVDGDKVAEKNADDEDDYQSDEETLRFSGLDLVAMDEEDVDVVIAVTLQNNIDAADRDTFTVTVESLRFFDADGVATTDNESDASSPLNGESASFTVVVEGVDDELTVKTSSNDPDSTTLPVEDDSKSDWYTVFAFDLDTDDSANDITIDEIVLEVLTAENTNAADAGYDDLVDDVELVIDGVTIDDVTVGGTSASAGTATLTFDVDGDVVIDAGDRVEAELMLKFNSLPAAEEGATVKASIASVDDTIIDAEGADTLTNAQLGGSATGDVHTLRTEGLILSLPTIDSEEDQKDTGSGDADFGTFTFTFEVTAFEQDFYIDAEAAVVNYDVLVDGVSIGAPAIAASSTATLNISGASDGSTADYVLGDGQAVEFTFTVETGTDLSGATKVVIDSIDYSAADDNTEELNVLAIPVDDWESDEEILN